ncbi:MAG: translocation/assembly module TamB domain-containing protein [Candidatus Berkiella sp.]
MKSFLFRHLEPLSILKKIAQLAGTCLLAALAFLGYCFFTPVGTKTALSLLEHYSPYQITFSDVKGTFATELTFKDIKFQTPALLLKAKYLAVDWDWLSALSENTIERIVATHADITIVSHEQKPQSSSPAPLEKEVIGKLDDVKTEIKKLPVSLKVANLELKESVVHWQNQDHHIEKLILLNTNTQASTLFQEIHYQGSAGTLDATIADTVNIHWNLHIIENPLLTQYVSGDVKTNGHILFPKAELESNVTKMHMQLFATKVHAGNHELTDLSLNLSGTLASHQATVSTKVNGYPVNTAIIGKVQNKKWQASLNDIVVQHKRWEQMGKTQGLLTFDWHHKKHSLLAVDALLWEQYPLSVELKVNKDKPYTLKGVILSQIQEIKTLAPLIPDLKSWRAKCNIKLLVGGNIAAPQFTGDILLKDIKLRHSVWGSKAAISQVKAELLPGKLVRIQGDGIWGSGPFSLKGEGLFKNGMPQFTLNLTGENLLLSDTPEYYIIANPDLTLSLKDNEPLLTGTIVVPHAEIQSLKNPEMVTTSDDVVIVSKQKLQQKPLTQRSFATGLSTNIDIILGKQITYKGHGISTGATGRMQIRQIPGQIPRATGQINLVNGKYRAYGKTFDIDHGQLVFAGGPINDPLLDIRAQRKIEPASNLISAKTEKTITAGVKFLGNLQSPKIEFFSVPAMSDTDIISYLVVGHPQHEVNEAQAELLLQAASEMMTIVGGGRKDVQLNFAEKLKLDQFGFTKQQKERVLNAKGRSPLDDTAFILGKQLSDRLYLHYSLGIVDSANNFGLRYMLGKNVMVEASTGSQGSSADVLLSFDGH